MQFDAIDAFTGVLFTSDAWRPRPAGICRPIPVVFVFVRMRMRQVIFAAVDGKEHETAAEDEGAAHVIRRLLAVGRAEETFNQTAINVPLV